MLIKGKNKAQEFCYGVGDGKNIYLKSIIILGLFIFQLAYIVIIC